MVFLEASDETLVRRFESVRRPHPLQEGGRVMDGIAAERELLRGLRGEADLVLDTSELNVHELRARMRDAFGSRGDAALRVSVVSFGFKYGLPVDADMVADCRFLPNPHWVARAGPADRPGRRRSRDYVLGQPGAARVPRRLPRGGRRSRWTATSAGGQALRDAGGRLHRRQAPQRGDRRGDRRPAGRAWPGVQVAHRDLGRE